MSKNPKNWQKTVKIFFKGCLPQDLLSPLLNTFSHLFWLHDILQIPDRITCYNGTFVSVIGALFIYLKRYTLLRFEILVPELCIINNCTLNFIYYRWNYSFYTMNQAWLSPNCLQLFGDAIYAKWAPQDSYWGFIPGSVRLCCRQSINQRIVCNAYKRVHGVKFQSVVTPNGLIVNLFGPVRAETTTMFGDSGLYTRLQQHARGQNHSILCQYVDSAYLLRPVIMSF